MQLRCRPRAAWPPSWSQMAMQLMATTQRSLCQVDIEMLSASELTNEPKACEHINGASGKSDRYVKSIQHLKSLATFSKAEFL
jgi:hypothetical protein